MNKLSNLSFYIIFIVSLVSCETLRKGANSKIGKNHSENKPQRQSLESRILALPKFRYHEENVDAFRARVIAARKDSHNVGKDKNFLYITGDGSFPPKEFTWNENSQELTVKSMGNEVDPSRIDIWKMKHGNLEIIK
jgi:hypothetical protein